MNHELILKYFPELTEEQKRQFDALDMLYRDWNTKINVISRKDIDNLYPHHILLTSSMRHPNSYSNCNSLIFNHSCCHNHFKYGHI